jgi:dienelactone hydrolase
VRRALLPLVLLAGCGHGDRRPVAATPAPAAHQRPVAGTYFAPPRGPYGVPVVVWGGSEGGEARRPVARALAAAGHPALSLAYFGAPGVPRDLESIPLEYFARAVRELDARPGVDGGRTVVLGVSRGSEAALLLGAHFPRLVHGVIAIAPSSKVNGAVHGDFPAWTLRGRPLRYALAIDAKGGFDAPSVIPVERIRGPILLAAGGRDTIWPSPAYERAIVRRLRRHHFRYRVKALLYPRAGHGIGGADGARLNREILRFLKAR